jgi:hypothetical protein
VDESGDRRRAALIDFPLTGTSFILVNRRPDGSSPGWPPAAPAPTEACAQDDAEHSQD